MASTYPTSIDSFTNPAGTSVVTSPDHALQHSDANDAIENVEAVIGTTSGTAIAKNITVGKFAVSNDGGTINNATEGTPRITGGTASAFLLGTSTIQGGTANNLVVGTPTISGATITSGTINNVTLGSPSLTGGTQTLPLIKTHTIGSAVYTGTVSTTQTLDLSVASRHLINMANSAGSVTLAVSNVTVNQPFLVEILQGTAGLGTINWFPTIKWAGSIPPVQTFSASRKDTFGFIPTGAATFDGYIVGQNI